MKKYQYIISEVLVPYGQLPELKAAHFESSTAKLRIKWHNLVKKHCKGSPFPIPKLAHDEAVPTCFFCDDKTYILVTDKVKVTE